MINKPHDQPRSVLEGQPPAERIAAKCELCGEPMPPGEQMFTYHGHSGPCPKPPLPPAMSSTAATNLPIVRALLKTGGEASVADHVGRLRIERDQLASQLADLHRQLSEAKAALDGWREWSMRVLDVSNLIGEFPDAEFQRDIAQDINAEHARAEAAEAIVSSLRAEGEEQKTKTDRLRDVQPEVIREA